MARVSITRDALDVLNTTTVLSTNSKELLDYVGQSPIDFLNNPWLLVLVRDGKNYYPLKSQWESVELLEDDDLHFICHVGDPVSIVIGVILVVATALILFASIDPPQFDDNRSQPDPLYTLDGRRNQARLNSPIEDAYGRNKLWLSYLSNPYTRFVNNEQDLYQFFTLGQGGDFDIEDVLIEDSSADSFVGINYIFDSPSYFSNNVSSAREVSSLSVFGSNESGYTGDIGGFAVNPANTVTNLLEIDWSLPNGCYYVDTKGRTKSLLVQAIWQYRSIDKDANPTGSWQNLYTLNQRFATNQGIRQTFRKEVISGRYEIRARRTNETFLKTTGTNKLVWNNAKAYLGNISIDSNKMTTLHVKTRASQNTVKNKVNVLATRKIPIWDGSSWSQPVATRNPIWAMVNILRSDYGARMSNSDLDLPALKICADLADQNNETFDFVFDQKTTVWDAVKICCSACRSTPLIEGNKITAKRDVPDAIPVQLFNSENIYRDTFQMSRKLPLIDENDGLKVEYYDHNTWKDETYTALLDHQNGIDPKTIKLRGVTNRTQAAKIANYILNTEYNNRVSIQFETTQSAIVANYGDIIKVQHDVPEWGSGGFIEEISGSVITLSEKPVFQQGYYSTTYVIWVRDKIGDVVGPFPVERHMETDGSYGNKVKLTSGGLPSSSFPINDNADRPHYILGKEDDNGMLCKINRVENGGLDRIRITATVENFGRFVADGFAPDDIVYPPLPDINIITLETFEIDPLLSDGYTATFYLIPTCIPAPPLACEVFDYIQIEYSVDGLNYVSIQNILPADLTNDRIAIVFPEVENQGFFFRARVSIGGDLGEFTESIFYYPNAEVLLSTDEENTELIDDEENNLYASA